MRFKYRTIDLSTVKGIKSAERLQRNGWRIISVGFNTIQMEKEIKRSCKHNFNRFQFQMTKAQARECSHQGDCYEDVTAALQIPSIRRQFKKISPDAIKAELKEYGAWDDDELADDIENQKRVIWLAAGDIREEYHLI